MQQAGPMEFLAGMMVCLFIFLAVYLVIYILFLLNLYRTLDAVAEPNRELTPGLVWLSLIPIFNIVWNPIMVPKISKSLENEFRDRGWPTAGEGFARTTGMLWAWGGVASVLFNLLGRAARAAAAGPVAMGLGLVGCPLAVGILVCWIMFWVQTYQYRNRLTYERGYRSGSAEEDYDDEYRGRGRPEGENDYDRPRRRRDDLDDDHDRPRRRDDEYGDEEDDRRRRPSRNDD